VAVVALVAPVAAQAAAVVFSATGTTPAGIQSTVDTFRSALGSNNGVGGSFPSGRREINWDGVPDASAAPNPLPANFFNVTSPRGVVFSTPGTGFQVSATVASGTPIEFGNIDPSYTTTFQTFSAERLFTPLGSNVTDVFFFLPGTTTAAHTNAFGAVFTDVDFDSATQLQFFDATNTSLGTFYAPTASGSQKLSFLGIYFNAGEQVARVRITCGNAALASGVTDGFPNDVVAMDDFVYAEPHGNPTAVTLAGASAMRTARGVQIRWRSTATVSTVGFRVYRELRGQRLRVTRTIVPARPGPAAAAYTFLDRSAPRTGRLRYWIRAVAPDSSASWLGSVDVR
jgi:hypothetical protein